MTAHNSNENILNNREAIVENGITWPVLGAMPVMPSTIHASLEEKKIIFVRTSTRI
jgi:hypothetical protein